MKIPTFRRIPKVDFGSVTVLHVTTNCSVEALGEEEVGEQLHWTMPMCLWPSEHLSAVLLSFLARSSKGK